MPPPANFPCHLTLVLPGLIWPKQAMYDLTRDLPTPSLGALLGKGRLIRDDNDANSWLRKAYNLSNDPSFAPLRVLGLTSAATSQRYLCLDPVNFSFADRNVIVNEPNTLQLTAAEANAFGESLGPVLQDFGDLEITSPGLWHVKVHDAAPDLPAFLPLSEFIGRRADQGLPADAKWRHLINEAQILLHNHPVNHARQDRGLPVVNSIWPWGGGSLVSGAKTDHDVVFADNPVLRGLSKLCGVRIQRPPNAWESLADRSPLILLEHLAPLRNQGNGLHWRDALAETETNWFAPVHKALRKGTLNRLTLVLPDGHCGSQLEVSQRAMLKIWRRPAPLTILAA
jgi:hypothetical protein